MLFEYLMAYNTMGTEIETLIRLLAKLPGFGTRSAKRATLAMVKNKDLLLTPLVKAFRDVKDHVSVCSDCGNIDTRNPCGICVDPARDDKKLIVVESVSDLWALERSEVLFAKYHVLGGALSALDGIGPEDITIAQLIKRCCNGLVEEVILAVNATMEGQATAYYIRKQILNLDDMAGGIAVTRLAHGIPIGGELDYLDNGTINQALRDRIEL